jgi:hypothetical protein
MNVRLAPRPSGPRRRSSGGGGPGAGLASLLPPGTLALLGVVTLVSCVALITPARVSDWVLIQPETLPKLRLTALLLSGFVVEPMSALHVLVLALIFGLIFSRQVSELWRRLRGTLILAVGLLLVTTLAGEVVLGRGYGVGWMVSLGLLASVAPSAERRWGPKKLLIFAGVIVLCAGLVGALLLWLWPEGAAGGVIGVDPLFHALIAVYALINSRRQLSGLPFTGTALLWAVVALDIFDVFFVSAVGGLTALAGVGAAVLLVTGDWHPARLIARGRLAVRRVRKKPRLTLVTDRPDDDGPTLH